MPPTNDSILPLYFLQTLASDGAIRGLGGQDLRSLVLRHLPPETVAHLPAFRFPLRQVYSDLLELNEQPEELLTYLDTVRYLLPAIPLWQTAFEMARSETDRLSEFRRYRQPPAQATIDTPSPSESAEPQMDAMVTLAEIGRALRKWASARWSREEGSGEDGTP